jgi:hypothetical protein
MRTVSSLQRSLSCGHGPEGRQSFDNREGTMACDAMANARSLCSGAHGVIALPKVFYPSPILIDLDARFLSLSKGYAPTG